MSHELNHDYTFPVTLAEIAVAYFIMDTLQEIYRRLPEVAQTHPDMKKSFHALDDTCQFLSSVTEGRMDHPANTEVSISLNDLQLSVIQAAMSSTVIMLDSGQLPEPPASMRRAIDRWLERIEFMRTMDTGAQAQESYFGQHLN